MDAVLAKFGEWLKAKIKNLFKREDDIEEERGCPESWDDEDSGEHMGDA